MTFDERVVQDAEKLARKAQRAVLSAHECEGVVVSAAAGAGKSYFVASAVDKAIRKDRAVAVCAPTNEQVFGLVDNLSARFPKLEVTFVPARHVRLPAHVEARTNVTPKLAADANHDRLIVGTIDKLGDAFSRDDLEPYDLLLMDEAYQADAARYFAVADLAPTHLLVGDSGQLDPFSTIDDEDYWRGLAEDPLQTAVGVLLRNHPNSRHLRMPITRRLDPQAVPVAQSFYPEHRFSAAVLPGVRELKLRRRKGADRRLKVLDKALDTAAVAGWAHLLLPQAPVLTADPETIDVVAQLVARLVGRDPRIRSELHPELTPLKQDRIAVGVSHNDQKDHLRTRLKRDGFPDVVVNTANKLQGLEFDVVIAWHPLAGLPDVDGFHLDPGRMCVLLTRHRHACIVVGRAGDRELLEGLPPATPAYIGWSPDPMLDGWDAHEQVFQQLEPHTVEVNA